MSRIINEHRRLLFVAALIMLVSVVVLLFKPAPAPPPSPDTKPPVAPARARVAAPPATAPAKVTPPPVSLFRTPDDARRYIIARILGVDEAETVPVGDPYASTFTRRYTSATGEVTEYVLAADPARELALAEGFLACGFAREALAHAVNAAAFYPDTAEGAKARRLVGGSQDDVPERDGLLGDRLDPV